MHFVQLIGIVKKFKFYFPHQRPQCLVGSTTGVKVIYFAAFGKSAGWKNHGRHRENVIYF